MKQRYFDVILLSDSLASRTAGALLAKGGCRVLTFRPRQAPSSPLPLGPLPASRVLERLLEILGARSCLAPAPPLQVVTGETRLEIHGSQPLGEELHREFGAEAPQVAACLSRLQQIGETLENLLLEAGLPVQGAGNRLRFLLRRLQKGLIRGLGEPLETFLSELPPAPRLALTTLLAGLALTPAARLSVAEAALLWVGALSGKAVAVPEFEKLLLQRYQQFHGGEEDLAAIQTAARDGRRLGDLTLLKGRQCGAARYLLGSPAAMAALGDGLSKAQRPPASAYQAFTSPLAGLLSPMLDPVIFPESPFPLRFSLAHAKGHTIGVLDFPASADAAQTPPEEAELRRPLAPLIPFGDFTIEAPASEVLLPVAQRGGRGPFPNLGRSWRLSPNLLICHGSSAAPALGPTGEILTGMTVAKVLLKALKKPALL